MKADGRRHYRARPRRCGGLAVELKYKRREFPAEVIDVSIGGIGVYVPRHGAIIAATPRETVYLKITAPSLPEPMIEPGTIEHTRVMGDALFIGVAFADWLGMVERLPPELTILFNRRASPRMPVNEGCRIRINARVDERDEEVEGIMRDLSAEGMAFTTQPDAGRRLGHAREISVSFEAPAASDRTPFKARLLHGTEGETAWSFGALFDDPDQAAIARAELIKQLTTMGTTTARKDQAVGFRP